MYSVLANTVRGPVRLKLIRNMHNIYVANRQVAAFLSLFIRLPYMMHRGTLRDFILLNPSVLSLLGNKRLRNNGSYSVNSNCVAPGTYIHRGRWRAEQEWHAWSQTGSPATRLTERKNKILEWRFWCSEGVGRETNLSISQEFKHGRKAGKEQQRRKAMKSISTIPVGREGIEVESRSLINRHPGE